MKLPKYTLPKVSLLEVTQCWVGSAHLKKQRSKYSINLTVKHVYSLRPVFVES